MKKQKLQKKQIQTQTKQTKQTKLPKSSKHQLSKHSKYFKHSRQINQTNSTIEKPTCIICFELIQTDKLKLKCNHDYHYDCIHNWCIKYRNRFCPICRDRQDPVNLKKRNLNFNNRC